MGLIIYAAYSMVRNSNCEFANAFKIIILGHIPSAILYILSLLPYFEINLLPKYGSMFYTILNQGVQMLSTLSVFIAIYVMRKVLFHKIERFTQRVKEITKMKEEK